MSIFGGREAKDLTAEIDRETDEAVLAEQGTTEAAKDAAGAVIDATGAATEVANEKVKELASIARAEAAKTEVAETEQAGWQAGEVSAETRALGSAALEKAVIASNNAIKEQVAIENGYVNTGLEPGKNVIGGASERQNKERSAGDAQLAQMESGADLAPELQWQAEILSNSQKGLTRGTVEGVERLTRGRVVKPAAVERFAWQMKMKELNILGRGWGERN